MGNLTQITNALTYPTTFTYDPAGRLTRVTDALGQFTQYGYDGVGNRTSMTDRKGQAFTYAYDRLNRLSQVSAPGQTIIYTYDPNSNRLTMADPTGTTTYAWDALDRWGKTTYPDGKDVQASYDPAGNRTSLTSPGGVIYGYGYDAANRLSTLTQGGRTWGFAYDGAGNRTSLTAPNGTSTTYTYLANNWLASITHQSSGIGGTVFQSVAYTYDPNGNRLSQTDPSGTTNFTYDALNRLTQAAHPGTYGTWGWTYDAVGNRTQQIAPTATTLYAYDRNNRLTQAGGVIYSYDPNGNLTGLSTGETFTYDPHNRLIQATVKGLINPATYTYNGDGLKVRRVGPDGATTQYYYDGIHPIWETDGAGGMTAQLDRDIFGNLLARTDPGGAQRYYHPDGLGSTTALTDELGTVSATMLYDAWGNLRANSGDAHGKYRFTGAELEKTTGLYHMGARFYDPAVGRWLGEDPVQIFKPATLNFYAYVGNNPMISTDPTGMCDLACLNEQRQAAAILALQTGDPVSTYRAYLEASRVIGHDWAMEALVTLLQGTGRNLVATTNPALAISGVVTSGFVESLYWTAAGLFWLSGLTEWTSFYRHVIGTGDWQTFVKEAAGNPFASAFGYTFGLAIVLDQQYFGGAVFSRILAQWLWPLPIRRPPWG